MWLQLILKCLGIDFKNNYINFPGISYSYGLNNLLRLKFDFSIFQNNFETLDNEIDAQLVGSRNIILWTIGSDVLLIKDNKNVAPFLSIGFGGTKLNTKTKKINHVSLVHKDEDYISVINLGMGFEWQVTEIIKLGLGYDYLLSLDSSEIIVNVIDKETLNNNYDPFVFTPRFGHIMKLALTYPVE